MRQRQRPINLNLFTIHFPLPAIVSFGHRVSGLVLIFLIPVILFALQESLTSEAGFQKLKTYLNYPLFQIGLWIMLSALGYHLIAGIRHILMDMHFFDSLKGGRIGAKFIVFLEVIIIIAGGYWIWWK